MSDTAVIIVPTQGEHASMFLSVAKVLNRKIYGGKATIVKTTVTEASDSLTVSFQKHDGGSFSWDDAHDHANVLTISHAFSCDGPNLAYHDGGYQPWGSKEDSACGELSDAAKNFWSGVGKAMKSDGKIILLGCFMGNGYYAENVAKAARRNTYAADGLFAAANQETALKYVKWLRADKVYRPMKKFSP